ncbi:hypothetical protein Dimus_010876 [Dionaea muscipula]
MEEAKGAVGAGSSGTQIKKKIPKGRKGKKATTKVVAVDEEKVPSEDIVGVEAENPTQESQAVAKKTKPPTKPKKKNIPSPTVGEKLVETEEDDSEATESDEVVGEDTQTVETYAVPVVSEEGQKKSRYKTTTSTGPKVKKPRVARPPQEKNQREEYLLSASGAPTDLPRAVPADVPDRRVVLHASGPTAAELDKEVDDLLNGKVGKAQGVKRGRKSLFTRGRLRSPSRQMVVEYMNTFMGPAGRATKQAMGKLPLNRELICFSISMVEASVLSGHVIHRVVKVGATQCKIIARLKEEKRALEANVDMMKEKRDLVEACLPKQMEFIVNEVVRDFLELEEFKGMFNHASVLVLCNGFKMGITQV